ncbi:MAG: PAS domain S-box protein [Candidatus Thorarchaeota archaeon]
MPPLKNSETDIGKNEDQYRRTLETILENIEDGYYEVDLRGNMTFFNDGLRRILGFTVEEMWGLNYKEYMSAEAAKTVFETFNKVFQTGQPTKAFDYEMIRKDGSRIVVEVSVSLIADPTGKPKGFRGILRDTTERRKLETALKESEAKYRNLTEIIPVGISISTPEGKLIDANTTLIKLLGLDDKEEFLEGVAADYWYDPKDREELVRLLKSGQVKDFEARFKRKDGSIFWGSTSTITQSTDGRTILYNTFQDITARKKAEEALRESERRFRELADLLPQTVFELDLSGSFIFANRYGIEASGYTQKDIEKGLNALRLFAPEDRPRVKEIIQRKLAGEMLGEHEYTAMRKDGSRYPVLIYSNPIIRDHKVVGLRGIVLDITDLRQAEDAIRESESKYRSVVETSPDAILMTNLSGTILMANHQAAAMAGFADADEITGRNVFDFFRERDRKRALDNMRRLLSFGNIRDIEFAFLRPDGAQIPADLSSSLIVDENGLPKQYMMIIRDISERKRAEETFKRQRAELSEFAHAMAKELQTHLQTMERYATVLTSDPQAEVLNTEKIMQLTTNMNELLQHLVVLADAGLIVDKAKVVDLGRLVQSVAEQIIPENVDFTQENLPTVFGDREKLTQIFKHLFENAIQHGNPTKIEVKRYDTDESTSILVSNDGSRISPAQQRDIFTRGYTTQRHKLGIGLAITQKLVEAHGWEISLEKAPETTFRIDIPVGLPSPTRAGNS